MLFRPTVKSKGRPPKATKAGIQFNKKSNQYGTKRKAASDNDEEPKKRRPHKSKAKETSQDSNSAGFVTINNTIPDIADNIENNLPKNNETKKRRGRPIGAKNKPKQHEIMYNMDLQESLPDIPEHGFMGEKTPAVQALEAQNSQKIVLSLRMIIWSTPLMTPNQVFVIDAKLVSTQPPRKFLDAQSVI